MSTEEILARIAYDLEQLTTPHESRQCAHWLGMTGGEKEMNPYTRNLKLAVLSGDGERINRETQRLMQAIANDLSAVTRKYGTDSAYHGLILAVVDSFAASLRLIADDQDLAIAAEISKHVTACTIDARGGKR